MATVTRARANLVHKVQRASQASAPHAVGPTTRTHWLDARTMIGSTGGCNALHSINLNRTQLLKSTGRGCAQLAHEQWHTEVAARVNGGMSQPIVARVATEQLSPGSRGTNHIWSS